MRSAILETCAFRGWDLLAVNVRTNHVHAVVAGGQPPERILAALKSWATRALIGKGLVISGRRIWARHGSTRYLFKGGDVERAIEYVNNWQ